jgi:hypothetical protein
MAQQPAARLKGLKDSVFVLKEPQTQQYIALADEGQQPRITDLHLATLRPATPEGLADLQQLASRRLNGVPYCLVRVDAL